MVVLLIYVYFDYIGVVDVVRDVFYIFVYVYKEEVDWLGDVIVNGF